MNEGHEELIAKISAAAKEAGKIMLEATDIDNKTSEKGSYSNPVTEYDKRVQAYLFEEMHKILPEANFLGEEDGNDVFKEEYKKGWLFVIDPIDGTNNFVHGFRPSTTSIGLFLDGKPYIGVIYNPYGDELFTAERGHGAYRNGKRIMSSDKPLSHSLVSMGTAIYYADSIVNRAFKTAEYYRDKCVDIRRVGVASYDFCLIAMGVNGLYFEPTLALWDIAAGVVIVEEAGGKVTDMDGKEIDFTGYTSITAVSRGVLEEGNYFPDF